MERPSPFSKSHPFIFILSSYFFVLLLLLWTLHLATMPCACPIVASCLDRTDALCYWTEMRSWKSFRYHGVPPPQSILQRHFKAAGVRFWCLARKSVPVGVSDDVELKPHARFPKQFSTNFRNPVARLCDRKAKIAASVCLACMLSWLFWCL